MEIKNKPHYFSNTRELLVTKAKFSETIFLINNMSNVANCLIVEAINIEENRTIGKWTCFENEIMFICVISEMISMLHYDK